ncbi:nitroreductase family protein [Candidatus Woesearchaeota archaeon]|nr:nitroreductase family protein [Candidatus Woesearchaeota archaeon]
MELFNCIKTRRAVRKYLDKKVPWDLVSKVIDAGRLAPSAGNLQNWKFIAVDDDGKKEAIAEACVEQTWMAEAPIHIVVCSEPKVAERYYGTRGERLYSIQNCAAAAENMLLMAHNLGLGACWVGAFDERMLGKAVGLPEEARPQAVIALGWPAEKVSEPAKFPLENVTYINGWRGKIRDVPGYMGYPSVKVQKGIQKGKEAAKKASEKVAEKSKKVAKDISQKIKEKNKRRKDLKQFKKVHGLK